MDEACDILAFGAHPDDVELGCGGMLILAAQERLRTVVADLSAGEMSTRGSLEQRQVEKTKAAAQMSVRERLMLGLPDSAIGADYSHREPIVEAIRRFRPHTVLAPFPEDRHPDHSAAGILVRDACFLAGVARYGQGAAYRPPQLLYYMIHHPFTPTFVLDISGVFAQKMAAIRAYESQFLDDSAGPESAISSPGFLKTIEARSVWYGAMIGAPYGEPFARTGPLRVSSVSDVLVPPAHEGGLSTYSVY